MRSRWKVGVVVVVVIDALPLSTSYSLSSCIISSNSESRSVIKFSYYCKRACLSLRPSSPVDPSRFLPTNCNGSLSLQPRQQFVKLILVKMVNF